MGVAILALFAVSEAHAQSEAYVEQVGTGNTVLLEQRNGFADIEQQQGTHLVAGFTAGVADALSAARQTDGSRLQISQTGGAGNRAFVEQLDGAQALELFQVGSGNLALVSQTGGGGNEAFLTQSGGASAHVTQMGSGNVARISQSP